MPEHEARMRATIEDLRQREQARLARAYLLPYDHKGITISNSYLEALKDVESALIAVEDVALQGEPVKEPMKLRTASQLLGWMDSVGPLTYAPGHQVTADAAICESRSPDGDKLADASMRGVGQRAGYEPERLGDAASVNAQQVTEAGSEPADSHQPIPAGEASPFRQLAEPQQVDMLKTLLFGARQQIATLRAENQRLRQAWDDEYIKQKRALLSPPPPSQETI